MVIVAVPELLLATLIVVGDALMVKFGFVPVTVRETVVVSMVLPEVPVTVMLIRAGELWMRPRSASWSKFRPR